MKSLELAGINATQLNNLTGGDAAFAAELVSEFVRFGRGLVSNLLVAVEKSDRNAVIENAHAIKGSSRTIGADRLASAAFILESTAVQGGLVDTIPALAEECRARFDEVEAAIERAGIREAA